MTDIAKRWLSVSVISGFAALGLLGCAALPKAIFTIGANDSPGSLLGIPCVGFLFPACVLALWKRAAAGVWAVALCPVWLYAVLDERAYMTRVRHFAPDSYSSTLRELIPGLVFLLFGSFLLFAEHSRWPSILKGKTAEPRDS